MPTVPDTFRAFVARTEDGEVRRGVAEWSASDLPDGDVTIAVSWSSVNYKDALATIPKGQVARISPLIPGIDLAGEVVASQADAISEGDHVLVHGYDLGVARHGGYAQYARVPGDWVVPLPEGLDARQAMAIGTAGFTSALSVVQLEERGLSADAGPVLVTGATGGVGSTAVGMLAALGYEVVASTGTREAHEYLRALGAAEVIDRDETSAPSDRPLDKQRWAAAVDCVGGDTLAFVLRTLRLGGAVAVSGNTGGIALNTTVLPFILRGVAILGVDSATCPIDRRRGVWQRLAGDLRPRGLDDAITHEITLDELDETLSAIHAGRLQGRTVVRVA